MIEYLNCECGSTKTYISVSGDVCCCPCFKSLKKKPVEKKPDLTARVKSGEHGFSVVVNGETVAFYTVYEDYAFTEAQAYARKLNEANAPTKCPNTIDAFGGGK